MDQAKEANSGDATYVLDHSYAGQPTANDIFDINELIKKLKSMTFVSNTEIVRYFQQHILQGRKLDIDSLDDVNLGETNDITVDRDNIVQTTFDA